MARTVLSTKHLYALLADSPDRPSISTVKRWVEGKQEMPGWALAAVAESLGIQEKPGQSFDWPGMMRKLDSVAGTVNAIHQRQDEIGKVYSGLVIAALSAPENPEVVRRLAERLGVLHTPSVEGSDDPPDTVALDAEPSADRGSS